MGFRGASSGGKSWWGSGELVVEGGVVEGRMVEGGVMANHLLAMLRTSA